MSTPNSPADASAQPVLATAFQAYLVPVGAESQAAQGRPFSIGDLFGLLLRGWKIVVATTVLGAAAGVTIALLMVPVYRAQAVVVPRSDTATGSLGRTIAGQLGGLGGLAGSLLPMGSSEAESVATLKSLAIAEALIRQRDLLPVLFEDRWDAAQGAWIVEKPGDEPTVGDGARLFDRRIRSVDHDRKTGVITVAVEWTDREKAADWANGLVQLANQSLRQRAIDEAQDMLKYLEVELGQTSKVELRTSMFQLVEAQQKTLMLANTREEYALRVVDPAVTPGIRDRVRPKRPLIAIAGTAVGGLIGCAIVLLLASRRRG